jgi:hypothetical protein|tara:strand:+ start:199 stop:561 length:363 start_codon:yes stop_codon:yes gene_type:complete
LHGKRNFGCRKNLFIHAEITMKYMITWTLYPETFDEALQYFSQMTVEDDREQLGDAVTLVGRWNDLVSRTGMAILESDDLSAVNAFCLQWQNVCDLTITPVMSDEEVRALGRTRAMPPSD